MNVESNVLLELMEILILDGVLDVLVNVLLALELNISALHVKRDLNLLVVNAMLIRELCLKQS